MNRQEFLTAVSTMSSSPSNQASSSPQRYRDDSFDEQRNDQVADNDEAPLLDTRSSQSVWSMGHQPKDIKTIRVLTALCLTSSVLAAIVLVALRIFAIFVEQESRYRSYELQWPTRAGSRSVGITVIKPLS